MTMSLTGHATQTTQVEQARAVAEVVAAVHAAQTRPRNEDAALAHFLRSCSRRAFAERAFWKFRRSTEMLTGPTIDFALEALRCWGNATSGTAELSRDADRSEMLAFAWDLETNTQRRNTFVNPHTGYVDTPFEKDGTPKPPRKMVAVRDIRENNQSAGSRVEREAILSVLPSWYVEEGIAACYRTLAGDATEPLEDRRRKVIIYFEQRHGVTLPMLEAKVGAPSTQWVDLDLAQLRVTDLAITRGETTLDTEFRDAKPDAKPGTTVDDLAAPVDTPAAPDPQGTAQPTAAGGVSTPAPSKERLNALAAAMADAGLKGRAAEVRERRMRLASVLIGRDVTTPEELVDADVEQILSALRHYGDAAQEEVATLLAQDAEERAADAAAPKESGDDPADGGQG